MKRLFAVLLMAFLLVSCAPKEEPVVPDEKAPVEEQLQGEEKQPSEEIVEPEPQPQVYKAFEYAVTARDFMAVEQLSYPDMVKEFLSAIHFGDSEVLYCYMQGETVEELVKIKADFELGESQEVTEYYNDNPFIGSATWVKMTVTESESDIFPVGTYEYVLKLMRTSAFFVEFFGPADRYEAVENAQLPDILEHPDHYKAYVLLENFLRQNIGVIGVDALDVDKNFDSLFHIAIHTRMALGEDFIFTTTLDEFKNYISLQYGIKDEAVLSRFTNRLANYSLASVDENGVYTVCCAHGYSSMMYEILNVTQVTDDGKYILVCDIFADSAHTVQCAKATFTFEGNEGTDIMTLTNIEYETLNNLKFAVISP